MAPRGAPLRATPTRERRQQSHADDILPDVRVVAPLRLRFVTSRSFRRAASLLPATSPAHRSHDLEYFAEIPRFGDELVDLGFTVRKLDGKASASSDNTAAGFVHARLQSGDMRSGCAQLDQQQLALDVLVARQVVDVHDVDEFERLIHDLLDHGVGARRHQREARYRRVIGRRDR